MDCQVAQNPVPDIQGADPGMDIAGEHAVRHATAIPGAAASSPCRPCHGCMLAGMLAASSGAHVGLAQLWLHPHGHVHG